MDRERRPAIPVHSVYRGVINRPVIDPEPSAAPVYIQTLSRGCAGCPRWLCRASSRGRLHRHETVSLLRIAFAGIMGQRWIWKNGPTALVDATDRVAGDQLIRPLSLFHPIFQCTQSVKVGKSWTSTSVVNTGDEELRPPVAAPSELLSATRRERVRAVRFAAAISRLCLYGGHGRNSASMMGQSGMRFPLQREAIPVMTRSRRLRSAILWRMSAT